MVEGVFGLDNAPEHRFKMVLNEWSKNKRREEEKRQQKTKSCTREVNYGRAKFRILTPCAAWLVTWDKLK